ncbi:MAG: DUF3536 domain-containing protein [Prochloraceae cyanobacterium]
MIHNTEASISARSTETTETKAEGIYVTVHGHFYQPPRENPYLDTIERQPSAQPFHDWNERIYYECYRPNAFSRIVNEKGEVVAIVNNFEYLSFNIGPTLMSWLENYDSEVYQKIIEADRQSCLRLEGHGNAIAQAYNHIILPLANERDKNTQILWGIEDFKSRFGRDPEGMWLAETAVDYPTLKVLIAHGIRFIILAPSQAEKCRPFANAEDPDPEWHSVGGSQIDPTRPYRCFLNETEYIDIFFYDGPISRDMGFGEVLGSTDNLIARLSVAVRSGKKAQLISVATDGETFGHHKKATEKCLAYAFTKEFECKGWKITNYAHYLSINPPTWEVELKPVTAWSCAHGVDRWQDDCGCGGGGEWHQLWRKPLRETLDWLRDRLIEVYEDTGYKFFSDPWLARDEYIQVIKNRSPESIDRFLSKHQCRQLTLAEQIDALRLLEMQRHALLMYTSCGWFFEELSRPEGVQILRYASRAIELAGDAAGVQLEQEFINRLETAPSNVKEFGNGAEVYRQLVLSSQIGFEQVAAHYAISSLFTNYAKKERVYCYDTMQLDYQKQQIGSMNLAVGQVRLTSEITWESAHFIFAVLHLGGWDFHCCIQPFADRRGYRQLKDKIFSALETASAAKVILVTSEVFGDRYFGLQDLFAEQRQSIMERSIADTKLRLDRLYTQVYRDNYSVIVAFLRDNLPVPQELQVAAKVALSHRCLQAIHSLESLLEIHLRDNEDRGQEIDGVISELEAIATEADLVDNQLKIIEAKVLLEKSILRWLWQILYDGNFVNLESDLARLERTIDAGEKLHLDLSLDRAQELYCHCFSTKIFPNCLQDNNSDRLCAWDRSALRPLLKLGKKLAVCVG